MKVPDIFVMNVAHSLKIMLHDVPPKSLRADAAHRNVVHYPCVSPSFPATLARVKKRKRVSKRSKVVLVYATASCSIYMTFIGAFLQE